MPVFTSTVSSTGLLYNLEHEQILIKYSLISILYQANLKFSEVREFFKIPFGLNSVLAEAKVWQLEVAVSASLSLKSAVRDSLLLETVSRSRLTLLERLLALDQYDW